VLAPRTKVTGLRRDRDRFSVATTSGTVSAREVVIATNGYTGAVTPWLRRRIVPIPSQIIVTESLGKAVMDRLLPQRRMMGDSSKLHHYYRPSPDGLRIMFGGRAGFDYLFGEMVKLFPELSRVRITHSWSGNTGYTFDTMPHIGLHDGMHYAMGFCGSGVSMGSYLGWKVAQRILGTGEGSTALDAVPFPTRPFYTGTPWFLPLAMAYYELRDKVGR
jgi:glycine/D-amino acid oxidase-like deaminating enzyme